MSLPAMLVSTLLNTKKIAGIGNADLAEVVALTATPTKFVAIITYYTNRVQGTMTSNAVVTSTDGVNWTATGYAFSTGYSFISLIYATGTNTLLATDVNGTMMQSTDLGTSWTSVAGSSSLATLYSTAKTNNPSGGEGMGWLGATVSADGNIIMFPGASTVYSVYGTTTIGTLYKSVNAGATWTKQRGATAYMNGSPSAVATNNAGMWVTVGSYGGTFDPAMWDYVTYSTDNGATWTPVTSQSAMSTDTNAGYHDVVYGNGMFMACGKGRIAYSTNGTTWTKVTTGLPAATTFKSIGYGNGKWVIISADGNVSYTSTNGTTWTVGPVPFASAISYQSAIEFTNGVFAMSNTVSFGTMT